MVAAAGRTFGWSRAGSTATLTLDTKENQLNYIGLDALDELSGVLDQIEAEKSVETVLVRSGKREIFSAGADVATFSSLGTARDATAASRDLQSLMRRITTSKKKWVAVIDGLCLGGGLEIALACDYRIATDQPSTRLAFPETELGLIPAGGGTQMLPRLVGLRRALDMILTARSLTAVKARQWHLVDEITRREGIDEAIERVVDRLGTGWHPDRDATSFEQVQLLPGLRNVILARARHKASRQTLGNYPAIEAAIACMERGLEAGIEAGLQLEAQRFGRLVVSRESRNLIWLFRATRKLQKPSATSIDRIGITGANSSSVAVALSSIPRTGVTIVDPSKEKLAVSRTQIESHIIRQRGTGQISEDEALSRLDQLELSSSMSTLEGLPVVLESTSAPPEDKRAIVESLPDDIGVVGIDTTAYEIAPIVSGTKHESRSIGSRLFDTLESRPLMELVDVPGSSPDAARAVENLAALQGRSIIRARDTPGGYVNRIRIALYDEALRMVEERYDPVEIEKAALEFGFQTGPLRQMDEIGLGTVERAMKALAPILGRRGARVSTLPRKMIEAGFEGRETGAGFFVYSRNRRRRPPMNRRLVELLGISTYRGIGRSEYSERLVMVVVNEVAWCMKEAVVATPTEADVGAVLGMGFPTFRGGPLKHVDTFGAGVFVRKMKRLERDWGGRFRPCPLLVEMAEASATFHE